MEIQQQKLYQFHSSDNGKFLASFSDYKIKKQINLSGVQMINPSIVLYIDKMKIQTKISSIKMKRNQYINYQKTN